MHKTSLPPIPADLGDAPQPRLGIAHLMLWMLTSAIFLALDQYMLQGIPSEVRIRLQAYYGILAMINGAAVAMVPIWITRMLRGGPPFPNAPGHYLGLLLAWNCVAQGVGGVAVRGLQSLAADRPFTAIPQLMVQFFVTVSVTPLGLVSLRCCWRPKRWMAVFLVFVISKALNCLGLIAAMIFEHQSRFDAAFLWPLRAFWISTIATSAALIVATAIDLARRVPRDWLHNVGVVTMIAQAAAYAGFLLAMWLLSVYGE